MTTTAATLHPLNQVEWVDSRSLNANAYNPNVVFTPELKLLERSLLRLGWSQPILVSKDGIIIDGFHRWKLAQSSEALIERDSYLVPVCRLDVSEAEAIILTVRMNRAKGDHIGLRMRDVVRLLIDKHGMTQQEVAIELGAPMKEIAVLYDGTIIRARKIAEHKYSKAWYAGVVPPEDPSDELVEDEVAEQPPQEWPVAASEADHIETDLPVGGLHRIEPPAEVVAEPGPFTITGLTNVVDSSDADAFEIPMPTRSDG